MPETNIFFFNFFVMLQFVFFNAVYFRMTFIASKCSPIKCHQQNDPHEMAPDDAKFSFSHYLSLDIRQARVHYMSTSSSKEMSNLKADALHSLFFLLESRRDTSNCQLLSWSRLSSDKKQKRIFRWTRNHIWPYLTAFPNILCSWVLTWSTWHGPWIFIEKVCCK